MSMSKEAVDRFRTAWIRNDGVRERFKADPGAVLREFGLSRRRENGPMTDKELEGVSAGTLPPRSMFSFVPEGEYVAILHAENGGPVAPGSLTRLLNS